MGVAWIYVEDTCRADFSIVISLILIPYIIRNGNTCWIFAPRPTIICRSNWGFPRRHCHRRPWNVLQARWKKFWRYAISLKPRYICRAMPGAIIFMTQSLNKAALNGGFRTTSTRSIGNVILELSLTSRWWICFSITVNRAQK